jgi:MFS family permease
MGMAHATQVAHSPRSPFRHTTFTAVWIATLVSNIGAWMYSSASAWLMTSLDADPLMVSLVQVAATLPMVVLALPAGALADIVDIRRFLIGAEVFIAVVSTLFAAFVWFHLISPRSLLLFILLIESGSAASAIGAVFALPWLKTTLGPNRLVAAGSIGTAIVLFLYGVARAPVTALGASIIAGVCWIAVLSTLNVSAQLALPEWVRGRGLAVYVTVSFGALTLGSMLWGQVARIGGVPMAHYIAAAGLLLTVPLTWRWQLQTGSALDLTPSMHWPTPVLSQHVESDAGPVLVTVEYRINETNRQAFLRGLDLLSHERRRDGAYAWGLFEDVAEPGGFLETFLIESWLEHLRQHKRVTNADRVLQQHVHRLLKGPPIVVHLIAAHPVPEKQQSRRDTM